MHLDKTSEPVADFRFSSIFSDDPFRSTGSAPAGAPLDVYAAISPGPSPALFRVSGLFGSAADFPLSVAPAKSASEIADALIRFTLQNGIDKPWLDQVIDKGLALGPVPQLKCVYVSPAMEEILNSPQNYRNLTDLLNELDRRESDVTGCLNLWDKVFYGTRLRSFGNDLWSQPDFFDAFAIYFASQLSVTPGQGAVNLFSYFFRKDRLDAKSIQTLDLFHARLKKITAEMI